MASPEQSNQDSTLFSDRRRGAMKRKRETPASRAAANKSNHRTPNAFSRRTPPRSDQSPRRSEEGERSRSRSRSRSPPRKLKRPGAGARISREQRDAAERARHERLEKEKADIAGRAVAGSGVEFVASHYNAVPERGREWRKTDSQIKGLRSLNNWIKSTLIQKFSRPEIPVQHLTVLDMACGKGGDLGKWEKAPQIPSLYVGCDIADVSIDQAKDRYVESQRKKGRFRRPGPQMEAQFYVHDAFKDSFVDIPIVRQVGFNPIIRQAGKADLGMGYGGFDVVSMMFALHYSFESEELVKGMLSNVAGALKKGGHFIGVMPNANVISAELKKQLFGKSNNKTPDGKAASPARTPQENGAGADDEDDWDPEKPSEPAANSAVPETQDGSDDEWDPEKPSEPVMTTVVNEPNGDENDDWDPEKPSEPIAAVSEQPNAPAEAEKQPSATPMTGEPITWGNSIYSITFPRQQALTSRPLPSDGIFRPAFGWKYIYHLVEAVDAPEFVVPFEILRAMAVEFGLELRYMKPFRDVLEIESEDRELGMLAERMGVKSRDRAVGRGTGLLVSEDELEAADFYCAFCFYRT
ncbi:mRNA capping enzyme, large subunit [Polychaeton citri CBS 116435]|uniref:mRNA cap guanine-N(7) methyltransferase n=1 Tax=Polychaeton citri CBS 116435 TaxID=1314669 RepID=A0A9P4PZH1_9PEZI|nr:mRNA capping enzyme, large subunit [Polychaeton citri CBS 116435]